MQYSFNFLGITFYSYSLFMFFGIIAFLIYGYICLYKMEKEEEETVYKTVLVAIPSMGVLLASAFVLNSLFNSIEEGRLVLGGITWAGGVFGAFIAFPLMTRVFIKEKRGMEIEHFSHLVPGIALGHAFGRVGCFLAGCCYGSPTGSVLGVVYPAGTVPALEYTDYSDPSNLCSLPLMPVQLFEAVFEVLLFVFMIVMYKRLKSYNISVYLVFYGVFRFALEFLRGDDRGATGIAVSPSQLMSILFIVSGIILAVLQYKKQLKNGKNDPENVEICTENEGEKVLFDAEFSKK